MPVVPGSRHFRGGAHDREGLGTTQAAGWTCPTCRQLNAGPPEAGCASCGAGTQAEVEKVKAAVGPGLTDAQLQERLCGKADLYTAIALPGLEPKARLSLARALAAYADTGKPGPDELTRIDILTWARRILAALETTHD